MGGSGHAGVDFVATHNPWQCTRVSHVNLGPSYFIFTLSKHQPQGLLLRRLKPSGAVCHEHIRAVWREQLRSVVYRNPGCSCRAMRCEPGFDFPLPFVHLWAMRQEARFDLPLLYRCQSAGWAAEWGWVFKRRRDTYDSLLHICREVLSQFVEDVVIPPG